MPFRPAAIWRTHVRRPAALLGLALFAAACSDVTTTPDVEAPVGEGRTTGTVVIDAPAPGARLSGSVVFKAHVEAMSVSQYRMVWMLDARENAMQDGNGGDEATVDLASWTWLGEGPYHVTFRAYDSKNRKLGETSVDFYAVPGAGTVTPPPPATSGSPLSGAKFYVDPSSNAKKTADSWRSTRPTDAAFMDIVAARPQADWFGDWSGDVRAKVDARVSAIVAAGALPVLVAYDIPVRDCNSYSGGGATSADGYRSWIRAFAAGLASRRAVVILEPDALAQLDCISAAQQAERIALLKDAVAVLAAAGALVYLDAGHSNWIAAATIAQRLRDAGVAGAAGFALNVSNFMSTTQSVTYGDAVRALVGSGGYVIDTSRNGLGSDGTWCNPAGRALGRPATGDTGLTGVHAFLYLKRPGESDGPCNGGPSAGVWWADYALGLAQRSATT